MGVKSLIEKLPGYNLAVLPLHFGQAAIATAKYDFPAKKLRVIGVTGTNGKTTTSFMIWKMLSNAGRKTGLLTTVAWGGVDGDEDKIAAKTDNLDAGPLHRQYEHMTTERVEILNERMRAIADSGAEFMVLEITSHALAQFRTLGVPIEVAVFTNLTHEHLDYHKTFERYRDAKNKLFKQSKFGVLNADDSNAKYFAKNYASGDIFTYGVKQGKIRATDIKLQTSGVKYTCGGIKVQTKIPGKFNIYNSLAAVCVGKKLGLTNRQIEDGIASLSHVEGRMTRIEEGQDFEVIVDYAHAPDALEKVFDSVKTNDPRAKTRKIIAVHGGAGRRDSSTREIRGEILGRESDIAIITEDDSRDEDPKKIAKQFADGAMKMGKTPGKDLFVNLDRKKAIDQAIKMAKRGDLVLILGKGHEKTILRADGPHDFEDIKVAQELLRKLH